MEEQWQTYRKLELIGDSAPPPFTSHSPIVIRLGKIWRSMTNQSIEKLSYKQQLYHLEQCLERECFNANSTRLSSFWRGVWIVLNQPLFEWHFAASSEPEIRRVADQSGRAWWYVHDPLTGQTSYLESEEEVQIWLEERLHY